MNPAESLIGQWLLSIDRSVVGGSIVQSVHVHITHPA